MRFAADDFHHDASGGDTEAGSGSSSDFVVVSNFATTPVERASVDHAKLSASITKPAAMAVADARGKPSQSDMPQLEGSRASVGMGKA